MIFLIAQIVLFLMTLTVYWLNTRTVEAMRELIDDYISNN